MKGKDSLLSIGGITVCLPRSEASWQDIIGFWRAAYSLEHGDDVWVQTADLSALDFQLLRRALHREGRPYQKTLTEWDPPRAERRWLHICFKLGDRRQIMYWGFASTDRTPRYVWDVLGLMLGAKAQAELAARKRKRSKTRAKAQAPAPAAAPAAKGGQLNGQALS